MQTAWLSRGSICRPSRWVGARVEDSEFPLVQPPLGPNTVSMIRGAASFQGWTCCTSEWAGVRLFPTPFR